jgi:quercetin dioxygenase-like cupin family protein
MVSFVFMSFSALAQDPVKACPNIYKKVLLENEQVRVMEIEFKSGDAADWHTHPNHVAYALTDGKLEITDRGKETQTAEFKAGDAIYMGAVTHKAKNTGTNTVKMIVTEIKNDKKAGMK